jgi:hypothetical protein
MTKQEAVRQFKDEVLPYIKEKYEQDGKRDVIARSEAWNNFADWLCQEGDITNWQCENWMHPRCCCW